VSQSPQSAVFLEAYFHHYATKKISARDFCEFFFLGSKMPQVENSFQQVAKI
jgi:hypothetical protein